MVDLLRFYSHLSLMEDPSDEDHRGVGYAVNRFVHAVNRPFSYTPLLNRDCLNLSRFRRTRRKAQLKKIVSLSFKEQIDLKSIYAGSFAERKRRPLEGSRCGGMC